MYNSKPLVSVNYTRRQPTVHSLGNDDGGDDV